MPVYTAAENLEGKKLVHENYYIQSGNGINADEKINRSDSFYHRGGLLGLIPLLEAGYGANTAR